MMSKRVIRSVEEAMSRAGSVGRGHRTYEFDLWNHEEVFGAAWSDYTMQEMPWLVCLRLTKCVESGGEACSKKTAGLLRHALSADVED